MKKVAVGLVLLPLLVSTALGLGDSPNRARKALLKDLERSAAAVEARVKGGVVALLDFRPEYLREGEDHATVLKASKLLQDQVHQSLLARSVMSFQVERDRPVKVTRNGSGALAKGLIFSPEDARYFVKTRKADYVLEGRVSQGAGSIFAKNAPSAFTLKLRLIDLKSGAALPVARFSKVDPKDTSIEEICSGEILPKYNRLVLEFAFANIGERIDRGECWDVPAHPLKKAGLRIRSYNFGTPVKWSEALPGDVVTSDTHVMVIVKPTPTGKGTTILHQNVGGKRFIIRGKLGDVSDLTVWRPGKPNPEFGNGKNLK